VQFPLFFHAGFVWEELFLPPILLYNYSIAFNPPSLLFLSGGGVLLGGGVVFGQVYLGLVLGVVFFFFCF